MFLVPVSRSRQSKVRSVLFQPLSMLTFMASYRKGNRPSYIHAAPPVIAIPLYEYFVEELQKVLGRHVPTGQFGADMKVNLTNDGPVTIVMDSAVLRR